MKKLLPYITFLALAVACDEIYGPIPESETPVESEGIELKVLEVKDSSFTFVMSPKGESAYYAYTVEQADAPSAPDPSSVYSVSCGSSIAEGNVKWTAEHTTDTVTVVGLTHNTNYQIYAVAGSKTGLVSEVAVASVKTTDSHAPEFMDFEYAGTTVVLYFDEPVVAKGTLKVKYYKRYTETNDIYNDVEAGSVTIQASDVVVDGDVACFDIPGVPAGAYYTVSWEDGAFADLSGTDLPGFSSFFYTSEEGYLYPYGVYGRAPFQSFDVTPIEATSFAEYDVIFTTGFDTENAVVKGSQTEEVAVAQYVLGSKTVVYELSYDTHYVYESGYCLFVLPEEPDRGSVCTVTIPAGTFTDEWGNSSNEFTYTGLYSYGYTLADLVGTYDVVAYSNNSSSYVQSTMVIEESDIPGYGNAMITEFMGQEMPSPAYGTFDVHGGTFSLYGWQYLDTVENVNWYFYCYYADYLNMQMPASGVITVTDDYLGYFYTTGTPGGEDEEFYDWDLYLTFDAQKVEAATTLAPAAAAPANVKLAPSMKK